jgi:hypothetical protein
MTRKLAWLGAALAVLATTAQPALSQQADTTSAVDPAALQALQRMSAYLGTLQAFEVKAATSADIVLDDGQKVQLTEDVVYKVRRPDGFVIERTNAYKNRHLIYDGKQLTVFSPRTSYYGQVPAPATIRQTLDLASDRYGIEIPLRDLFRWSEPGGGRVSDLKEGILVGPARINGVDTDQYAFRDQGFDWQIWIARGPEPTPRRIVIVDRSDEARPQFTADLAWNVHPSFAPTTFAFQPPPGAKAIQVAAQGQ